MAAHTGGRSTVPGEQRVFSLVLALVASPQGVTKRDLLSSVYGYAERYAPGTTDPALERQFERDKNQLRELGVRIETLDSPEESGNNQLTRYRISKEMLQVPQTLQFSDAELALLRAAAFAWSEGSLSAQSRRAVIKLTSLGSNVDAQHLGVAPQLGISESAAPALQRAIDGDAVVTFDYWMPDRESPAPRRVAPLRLHRADGRWHLIAYDLDRSDDRTFLLSRIHGPVRLTPEAFDRALVSRAERAISELEERARQLRALIHVRTGTTAEARLAPRGSQRTAQLDGFQCVEIGTLDFTELARELCGYGGDVRVAEPAELKDRVIQLLRGILQTHDAEAEG